MDFEGNKYLFGGIGALVVILGAGFVLMSGGNPATSTGGTGSGDTLYGDQGQQNTQPAQQQNQQSGTQAVEVVSGASADKVVETAGTDFAQSSVQVSAGDVIKFKNTDSWGHTVTINTQGIDKQLASGSTVTLKFNEGGSYTVVCTIHSGMSTDVTVSG